MQDEHAFIWQAMLDTIDIDLAGRRVLDAGCNRGGFLRLLVARSGIEAGYGYESFYLLHDLAAHAAAIHGALVPGGVYYAVIGVHARSPGIPQWHAENAQRLDLPKPRSCCASPARASEGWSRNVQIRDVSRPASRQAATRATATLPTDRSAWSPASPAHGA